MELENGIVVFGGDAHAAGRSLREPGGLLGEGLLDAAFASQDVAMECKSAGIGNALVGAGHGKFSVVTFREIAKNSHTIYLGFRVAAGSRGNGCCRAHVFDSWGDRIVRFLSPAFCGALRAMPGTMTETWEGQPRGLWRALQNAGD